MLTSLHSGPSVHLLGGGSSPSISNDTASQCLRDTTCTLATAGGSSSFIKTLGKRVPSLSDQTRAFKPPLALSLGDIQTVFSCFATFYSPLSYDRLFLHANDGGTLAIDYVAAPWLTDDAPIVILLPGLTGSSQNVYISSAVEELVRLRVGPAEAYRAIVVNTRGSHGCPLTSANLTHAGSTSDLKTVISHIQKCYPEAKGLFALGFSMGGALLSNYLAEEGDNCPVDAAFCVSTVWDLEACSKRIENGPFLRRLLYSYGCGTNLAWIVRSHEKLFRVAGAVGLDKLLPHFMVRMTTFNDAFMSHLAGYANTAEFAAATSPIFRVANVRRPCVFLNARDDPLYGGKCLDDLERVIRESRQERLVLVTTKRGGHLGWFHRNKEENLEQWFVHPVREFFDAMFLDKIAKQDDSVHNLDSKTCVV